MTTPATILLAALLAGAVAIAVAAWPEKRHTNQRSQ